MTDKQIEARQKALWGIHTPDAERLNEELSCREMINSCLCYGSNFYEPIHRWVCGVGYANRSYAQDYIDTLGKEVVDRLYQEQKEDFSKARVIKNAYTDSEGLTYNSIIWEDQNA